jgi:hypothetical protein
VSKRHAEELYDLAKDPHQLNNLAANPEYASILKQHREQLGIWEDETDDKGRVPASKAELKKVYDQAPDKCVNPEYYLFKGDLSGNQLNDKPFSFAGEGKGKKK